MHFQQGRRGRKRDRRENDGRGEKVELTGLTWRKWGSAAEI